MRRGAGLLVLTLLLAGAAVPALAQAPYPPDPYDDPVQANPDYGNPAYRHPGYGNPAYGDPAYGDPAYGDPAYDDPGYRGLPPASGPYDPYVDPYLHHFPFPATASGTIATGIRRAGATRTTPWRRAAPIRRPATATGNRRHPRGTGTIRGLSPTTANRPATPMPRRGATRSCRPITRIPANRCEPGAAVADPGRAAAPA